MKQIKALSSVPLLIFFSIHCSHTPTIKKINLVWPNPPDMPRIKYTAQFSSPQELGITTRWHKKLHQVITGKKEKKIRIISPYSIFIDRQGDIYITDTFNPSIHVFSRSSRKYKEIVSISGLKMYSPIGIAVDARGRIFVADSVMNRVYVINKNGKHLFSIDSDHFKRPTGIALDQELERIYVVDTLDHKIKCFTLDGRFIKAIGGIGTKPGEFNFPTCICIDKEHRVYIGDSMNFRIQIFNQDGNYLQDFGQPGDGTGYFSRIKGLAVDSMGHIYVSDAQFDVIQVFDISGNFLLSFGQPGRQPGEFQFPAGIYIDNKDMIYIVDKLNQRVQIFEYLKENDKP